MKISKLEGIRLLAKLNLPTVELLDMSELVKGQIPIEDGVSVRLSPKNKSVSWNVGLPSINKRTDLEEIRSFVSEYENEYDVFAHKTVKPEMIGTLSKFESILAIETYKSYEDKHDELIDNRIVVPVLGDRFLISQLELLKKSETDFNYFRKVINYLRQIPFSEYEMEFVIEDGQVVFMDFTVANDREYQAYRDYNEER